MPGPYDNCSKKVNGINAYDVFGSHRGLWGTLVEALGTDSDRSDAVRGHWREQESQQARPLTLILDQIEEVYTRPDSSDPEELDTFFDRLKTLLAYPRQRPQGKLILGFRQEWLPELEQGLAERELPRSPLYLEPLDRQGLVEAITGPIYTHRLQQRYGLTIDDGLPETIADMLLADPDAPHAPTLQVLLAKLWSAAEPG